MWLGIKIESAAIKCHGFSLSQIIIQLIVLYEMDTVRQLFVQWIT